MAYRAQIRALGLATIEGSISVLWEMLTPATLMLLRMALRSERITKVFHNGLYDFTVFTALGFVVAGPWFDTLLASHNAHPGSPHGLQHVVSFFYLTKAWKSEFRNAEETPESLTQYNALDVSGTLALVSPLTLWIKKTASESDFELDLKMAKIASSMHLYGAPVSREVNSDLLNKFRSTVIEARRAVEEVAEDPELRERIAHHLAFEQASKTRKGDSAQMMERYEARKFEIEAPAWRWKISAAPHIAALLKAMGAPMLQRTTGGTTATKKEILEGMVDMPIVRDILAYRENDKLLSTFIWPTFDQIRVDGSMSYGFADENDRVHPIWNIHKITGRWASSEPVMSNVPKDISKKMPDGTRKILRPNLRTQVVAPKGRIFVGFDYSQLEARIIALISGDPWLCKVFADNKDIHRECAMIVWPTFATMDKADQKALRDGVKPLEYGAFYGGSVETLWKAQLKEGRDIKLADVTKAVGAMMRAMPGVVQWQHDCVRKASTFPFEIRTFTGSRRRTFPLGNADRNESINFGVQAQASRIMNIGMARMDDALKNFKQAFAILQIHDAAVFECYEDDAEAIKAEVVRCFTQDYTRDGLTIPFPIEAKIGRSWADV